MIKVSLPLPVKNAPKIYTIAEELTSQLRTQVITCKVGRLMEKFRPLEVVTFLTITRFIARQATQVLLRQRTLVSLLITLAPSLKKSYRPATLKRKGSKQFERLPMKMR